jgi:hypothetical protein
MPKGGRVRRLRCVPSSQPPATVTVHSTATALDAASHMTADSYKDVDVVLIPADILALIAGSTYSSGMTVYKLAKLVWLQQHQEQCAGGGNTRAASIEDVD